MTVPTPSGSSSSSSSPPSPKQPTQQPQTVRKPAYADWPTLKILSPPQGRFSNEKDEWCITYCTQTVRGRFNHDYPNCRSLCIRRVFAHEVRNIVSFRRHSNVDEEGKAKYPLPPEGQPLNVPRFLGGTPPDPDPDHRAPAPPKKYWEEGWYLWTTSNPLRAAQKFLDMNEDIPKQVLQQNERAKKISAWLEYQQFLEHNGGPPDGPDGGKWWGAIAPPRPLPDFHEQSLLIPLPPDISVLHRLDRALKPTWMVLGIFQDSVSSGTMKRFAHTAWEKALSKEPWMVARHALQTARETLFKGDKSRDDDKDRD